MGVELVKACSKNLEEFALISANFVRNLCGAGVGTQKFSAKFRGAGGSTPEAPSHREKK